MKPIIEFCESTCGDRATGNNLFLTSKKQNHEFTKSQNKIAFLIYYLKKHFKPFFLILKALKDIL